MSPITEIFENRDLIYIIPGTIIYITVAAMLIVVTLGAIKDVYIDLKWYYPFAKRDLSELFLDFMKLGLTIISIMVFIIVSYEIFKQIPM